MEGSEIVSQVEKEIREIKELIHGLSDDDLLLYEMYVKDELGRRKNNGKELLDIWVKFKSDFKIKFDHTGSLGANQYISNFEFGRFLDEADKAVCEIITKSKMDAEDKEGEQK